MRGAVLTVLFASAASNLAAQSVLPTWKLDAIPGLTIEGDGPAEFFRISGVVRLSTGHVAVVNAGTNEIRVFDAKGTHTSTFGRTGSGPGEFRAPGRVWRSGDTLMIDDFQLLRFTALLGGPEVKQVRVVPLAVRSSTNRYTVEGRSADGRWLVLATESFQWVGPDGIRRLKAVVGLIPASGSGKVDSLAEVLSGAYSVWNPSGDVKQGSFIGLVPFTPWAYAGSTSSHIWFGDGSTDSVVAMHGTERRVVRLPFPVRQVSSRDKEAFRARTYAKVTDPRTRAVTDQMLSAKNVPKNLPFYEALLPGFENEVWIQEYTGVNSAATKYLVIGSDLKPRAWVPVPKGFRIKDVGRDYVAGVHFDEDELETVRIYRLTR